MALLVPVVGVDDDVANADNAAAAVSAPVSPVRSESIGESCRREFAVLLAARRHVRRWLDEPLREACRNLLTAHRWSLPDDAVAIGTHIESLTADRVDALLRAGAAHTRVAELLGILVHVDDAELAQVLEVADSPQFGAELREYRADADSCAFATHGARTRQCLVDAQLHRTVAFVTRESPARIATAALAAFRAARSFDVAPLPNWPLVCLPMAALWRAWRAIHERCALAPQHQLFIDQQLTAALQQLLTHLADAAPDGASMPGAKMIDADELDGELGDKVDAAAAAAAAAAAVAAAPVLQSAAPDYFACVRADVAQLDDTGELMVEYISREELVVKAFHVAFESSSEQMWSSVAGDGNCFFRALTHVFLPILPQACEKRISLDLRRAVIAQHMSIGGAATPLRQSTAVTACDDNGDDDDDDDRGATVDANGDADGNGDDGAANGDGGALGKRAASSAEKRVKRQRSQLADFAEIGVDDEATMEVAGTWASHVQVLQAAAFLERTVLLLRPDDQHLDVRACDDTDSPRGWRVGGGGDDASTESDPALRHAVATPRLMPGDMYTIAPPAVSEAAREHRLSLLFSPWPGHYDACVNKALASCHVAMTQEDRWGKCLCEMVRRADQSHHVRAQLGVGAALFAANVPSIRLSRAEASVGVRFALALCAAPIRWPPTAEAVFAVYSALEFHAECCANALAALERKPSLPRGTEAAKLVVVPVLRAARVLRRRCGLLATALAAVPADQRALPSLGAVPRRFIDLVLAPLFSDSLIYVDGDDEAEGIVHAEAGGGPLSAIAARFGGDFMARASALLKLPQPVSQLPPLTSQYFSQSSYGSTVTLSNAPRTAPVSAEVTRHFQVPSYATYGVSRPYHPYPGSQALLSVPASQFYNRAHDLSSRVNRGVARPIDRSDLSSVMAVGGDTSSSQSDDGSEEEFPATLSNVTSPNLNAAHYLKILSSAVEWQKRLVNAKMLRFDDRRQGDINGTSLRNMFMELHKSNMPPLVVFRNCEFSADLADTLFSFCDKITIRFVNCTFNGCDIIALKERIRRSASGKCFEISE